jgi:secreted PhoX family phosphatase
MNEFDQTVVNPRDQDQNLSDVSSARRQFIGYSSLLLGLFAINPLVYAKPWGKATQSFTFNSVAMSRAADDIALPEGYRWAVVAAWGDPINGKFPHISYDVLESAEKQAQQFGMHHDGCTFFPDHQFSDRGLWVVNHEYTDDGLLHSDGMTNWSADKVRKSQAAHGVTVCHIEKNKDQSWRVVDGPFARRITAYTSCKVSGPAAGHELMKTTFDPSGKWVNGTLNNCSNGVTPWGTYLTCEENFNGYFVKKDQPTPQEARVGINNKGFGYRWHEHDERFDVNRHPNEANRFGWVVEIDPKNPTLEPVKRTALGRFKHEGAQVTLSKDRRVVVYMGDDQKGEYIYRYVSRQPFKFNMQNPGQLMDDGILHVARFRPDGTGIWIPLEFGKNGLTPQNGFADQAYILIHARMAADYVKATPMDRPEWIAKHPASQDVYVTLTNNSDRGKDQVIDASNPRKNNVMGHIVRWKPEADDAASENFNWEIFVLAGDPQSQLEEHRGNIKGDFFGSPDGLWFDRRGILWTQTDISTSALGQGPYKNLPNNALYAADPVSKEFRRFLIGPKGCEITGIDMTPNLKTMFINIQHPGETASERSDPKMPKAVSSWPDKEKFSRPRSATIAIWREDGREIAA